MGEPKRTNVLDKNFLALLIIGGLTVFSIWVFNYYSIEKPAQEAERQHWAEQAKTAPENLRLICPPSQDGKPIPAEQCERAGHYEYDRKQQILDHNAQLSMRNAAWLTAVFTGFGLVLVGFTLVQAFKATDFAKDALETTQAQQRPWVTMDVKIRKSGFLALNTAAGPSADCHVDVIVTNIGKTPAQNLTIVAKPNVCEGWYWTFEEQFGNFASEFGSIAGKHALLPGEKIEKHISIRFPQQTLMDRALGGGRNRTAPYFIAGAAYSDGSEKICKTVIGGIFEVPRTNMREDSFRFSDIPRNKIKVKILNGLKVVS